MIAFAGGDPYAMLPGLQFGDFDAVMMTGFHAGVGSAGSPASNTFNRKTTALFLNGMRLSEFLFDAYSAAYLGVPMPFLGGDSAICAFAREKLSKKQRKLSGAIGRNALRLWRKASL